jgi:hypothetical protein
VKAEAPARASTNDRLSTAWLIASAFRAYHVVPALKVDAQAYRLLAGLAELSRAAISPLIHTGKGCSFMPPVSRTAELRVPSITCE